MNTLSIPVVAMAGMSLYVGFYHLLIYLRRRQSREDLTFALLCFAIVFYDAFCVGLYNATSVIEGAQWQRAQFVALAVFVPAFLWFVSDYTRQKPGSLTYLFSAFYLVAMIVQLLDRSNLTFQIDQPSIKYTTLPHIQPITYYEATLGPFTTIQSLMGPVAGIYILILSIRYFRRGYKREATPLILAIGLMFAASFHDTLVSNGIYHFVYLMEYAYLAVILLMAYSLSSTIVEATIIKEELRKSEERFRSLVETISDWVWEIDTNGIYTYASPNVRDLLGYEPEEIIGRTPIDLMDIKDTEHITAVFQDNVRTMTPLERTENIIRRKDGVSVVLETSGTPFFDEHGKLLGYRGIARDITKRKQAEAQIKRTLHETHVRFEVSQALANVETEEDVLDVLIQHAGLYTQAHVAIFTFDQMQSEHTIILQRLDAFESDLPNQISAGTRFSTSHVKMIKLLSPKEPFISNDVRIDERLDPDSREMFRLSGAISHGVFPLNGGNEWLGSIAVTSKLTGYLDEEKQHHYQTLAEQGAVALRAARLREAIRESEQKFRLFIEQSSDGLVLTDEQGIVLEWNQAQEHLTGMPRQESLGRPLWDIQLDMLPAPLPAPELRAELKQRILLALQSGQAEFLEKPTEITLFHRDGTKIIIQQVSFAIKTNEGYRLGAIVRDITERKLAEQALQAKTEELDRYFNSSLDLLCIADIDGYFHRLNPEWETTLGYTLAELEGRQFIEFVHPEDVEATTAAVSQLKDQQQVLSFENRYRCKDGSYRWIEWRSYPAGKMIYAVARDITERKRIEDALEKRIVALTQPLDTADRIAFEDLFNLADIQHLQDLFASAFGVSALITRPDGTPITQPSNFTYLCSEIVRKTPTGIKNCNRSDAMIGKYNPTSPNIAPCLSGGLRSAGTSIAVGGHHIANWLIGQVRNETYDEEAIMKYAREIGVDEATFRAAYRKVPVMSQEQFEKVAQVLFVLANQLSTSAYQNVQQARFIAERKQAEEELRVSEERYRTLVEVSPIATWITRDQTITYVNPAALQIFGANDAREMVGKSAMDFVHPDYRAVVIERITQMMATGKTAPLLEEKYLRPDGGIVDVEVIATPFLTSEGPIVQVFFQDITKRKQAEEALRESEMRHRALIESQVDLVSRYLPDTRLTYVNDAYCKFFGKTREELIGQSYMFMIAPEHREFVANDTKRLAEEKGTVTGEYINYRYDGQERWIQWVVKCITDESGHVIELQGVGRDITQIKEAQAERERLIAELESKNAELERFTYTVSHDLKAPLITIRGFLGYIEQDTRSGDMNRMQEDFQRITDATNKMQRLLSELLELSRIGRLMNPSENIIFADLTREAIKLMEVRLRERNIEVKVQDDLPILFGDSQRLSEVIQNLLDNAIKFIGEQPKPLIEIGTAGEENGMPVLYVKDNGIGIAPKHHERIFGLFNKLDPKVEGTGVGLAIVKRIIEVHGGRIWVESEEGKGTTFYFTLKKGAQNPGMETITSGKL